MEAKPKIASFGLEFCQTNLLVSNYASVDVSLSPLFALCPETAVTQTMLSRCHLCLTFEIDIGCKVRNPLKGSSLRSPYSATLPFNSLFFFILLEVEVGSVVDIEKPYGGNIPHRSEHNKVNLLKSQLCSKLKES